MEKDFIVLGATAIEDCLQQDVPETIQFFRNAGVKLFFLIFSGSSLGSNRRQKGHCCFYWKNIKTLIGHNKLTAY